MTTTYELYTNENGTPKAVEGKAPAIIERVEALKTDVTGLQSALDGKQAKGDYATTAVMNTELAKRAPVSHTHTVSQITDMPKVVLSVNDITPDDSGNVKVGALPLGHLFAWPFQTPPDGAIQCNGATYNRALYKDFFAYATSKGWVKTEAEWQSIATSNGGFCPYYSQGNGSTTFRTPKFAPFMQIVIASGDVGKYLKAGLPNITGDTGVNVGTNPEYTSSSGAFYHEITTKYHMVGGGYNTTPAILLDASRSSKVYGASDTVQPESHGWMICVVVAGQATNLGSVDMADVLTTVAQVQAEAVKSVNGQKPNNAGNVTIEIKSALPNYSSYVQIEKGDFTPVEDGWLRLENMSNGDHTGGKVVHKASGAKLFEFYQNRYPGTATGILPVLAGETYTVSNTGSVYFHPMR